MEHFPCGPTDNPEEPSGSAFAPPSPSAGPSSGLEAPRGQEEGLPPRPLHAHRGRSRGKGADRQGPEAGVGGESSGFAVLLCSSLHLQRHPGPGAQLQETLGRISASFAPWGTVLGDLLQRSPRARLAHACWGRQSRQRGQQGRGQRPLEEWEPPM